MLIERSDTSDPARRPVASFRTRPAIAVLLLAFCVALTVLGEYLAPGFASTSNILQLLKIASFLGLVAMGQTVVMLVGGIDLSVAWVLTGAAVVFTNTSAGSDANAILAVSAALLVGVAAAQFVAQVERIATLHAESFHTVAVPVSRKEHIIRTSEMEGQIRFAGFDAIMEVDTDLICSRLAQSQIRRPVTIHVSDHEVVIRFTKVD